jgi:UMP-CMP kinase
MDQAEFFESEICSPSLVLLLDCPPETLQERLVNRAETCSRLDDGAEIVQKRLKTFAETTMPVVQHYMAQNRVLRIDASHEISTVYREMQTALEKGLGSGFQRTQRAG